MGLERKNVRFKSVLSTADNCICSACHGTGQVMKLSLPETLYFDGKHLTTEHSPYWLCRSCRDKLANALEWNTTSAPTENERTVTNCEKCRHH